MAQWLSICLPPMWPGLDSQIQMWVEFVVGSRPCSERFFSVYSGFSPPQKPIRSGIRGPQICKSDCTVTCHHH